MRILSIMAWDMPSVKPPCLGENFLGGSSGFLARCGKPLSCWVGVEALNIFNNQVSFLSLLSRKDCPSMWNTSLRCQQLRQAGLLPGFFLPLSVPLPGSWLLLNHPVSICHHILLISFLTCLFLPPGHIESLRDFVLFQFKTGSGYISQAVLKRLALSCLPASASTQS